MATYSLWNQAAETVTASGVGNNGTNGLHFTVSAAGALAGIWHYSPSGFGQTQLPVTIGLYNYSTQTLIHSEAASWSGAAGSGWVYAGFSSPPSLAPGTDYMAVQFRNDSADGWFVYYNSQTWPASNGPITAPDDAGAGQGWFNTGTALAFPASQDAGYQWWMDVAVTTPGPSQPRPARGGMALRKSRASSSRGSPAVVVPPTPSPFAPPPKAAKGKAAAAKSRLRSSPGAPVVLPGAPSPSPFTPPPFILRAHAAIRKARLASSPGSPAVFTAGAPSPFAPPRRAVRGGPAARKSRLAASAGSPAVLSVISGPSLQLPGNLLTPPDCDFGTWTGDWTAGGNTAVAQSASAAFYGPASMSLASTAAGSVTAVSPYLRAMPSAGYIASGYLYATASGRTGTIALTFYNSSLTSLGTVTGASVALAQGAFAPVVASAPSPAGTAYVRVTVTASGLGAGETAFFDLAYCAAALAQFLAAWYTQPGAATPVWADITPWVRADKGVTLTRGRDDEVSESQAGKTTLTVDNTLGWFSVGSTASPWYPNVLLGRRLQVNRPDETGAWHTRADMRLTDLPVQWEGGPALESLVQAGASGLLANVGRLPELRTMLEQEILLDAPMCLYTLADPSGSATASDSSGNGAAPLIQRAYGSGGALAFGTGTAIVEAGSLNGSSPVTSLLLTPRNTGAAAADQNDVQLEGWLPQPVTTTAGFTFEIWSSGVDYAFNAESATWFAITLGNPRTGQMISIGITGGSPSVVPALQLAWTSNQYSAAPVYATATLSNAYSGFPVYQPGMFAVTVSGGTATLWYNEGDTMQAVGSVSIPNGMEFTYLTVGGPLGGNQGWQGSLNCAAVYPAVLTSARLADHWLAGWNAYADDWTYQMIGNAARYAGIPSQFTAFPTAGVSRVDTYTLSGQTPLAALQAYEQADGGVLYENAAGQLAYQDRTARYAAQASTATYLALAAGQYEPDFLPSATDQFLQNDSTVSTPLIAAGVRALNAASVADYGTYPNGTPQSPVSGPYYSLPNTGVVAPARGSDVIADAASWNVGVNCQPGPRSPKVTVDLLTAPGDGLSKAAVYGAEIGTMINLAGLPSQAPGGVRPNWLMIEGVAETFTITSEGAEDTVTFNTSPSMRSAAWIAGDSAMGVLDSTAVVGRGSDGGPAGYVGPPYAVPAFSGTMNLTGNVGAEDLRGLWFNVQQQVTPPCALAVQIANGQSLANATAADIIWDTLYLDTAVGWTLQTGNAWYTVQVAGVYLLAACVQFTPNATGDRSLVFQQNGGAIAGGEAVATAGSTVTTGLTGSVEVTCSVGDQLKVTAYQSSGGALTTSISGGGSCFSILFMGT